MKIIEVENVWTGVISKYEVPSVEDAEKYSVETWGSQHDPVERKKVTGGWPMVWKSVADVGDEE